MIDVLEFVHSRDIRAHLRSIEYRPSTVEAAYLVWFSKTATLEQKCEAWQEIVRTMPNCSLKATIAGFGRPAIPDFHAFLRWTVDYSKRCVEAFRAGTVYVYQYEEETVPEGQLCGVLGGPFSCYEKCAEALSRNEELAERPEARIRITRCPLDVDDAYRQEDWLMVNGKGEALSVYCPSAGYTENNWDTAFEFIWVEIPTPFHTGDILWTPRDNAREPFVLYDLPTWDRTRLEAELRAIEASGDWLDHAQRRLEHYRKEGDISNMCATGCTINYNETFSLYIGEPQPFYLDLEYYHGPFEDEKRILIAAQAYLRGDLAADSLVAFIDTIRMESKARRNLKELRLDQTQLKGKYPGLFDGTINAALFDRSSSQKKK